MRPYATVSPLFWTGGTGKRLRQYPDAQRVAFYLMTCPHSHQSGLYYLPLMYLCHEVGIDQEGALKALLSLSEEGFCKYDEASEWVWVCEMAAWQIGSGLSAQDKRCKGLQQYLSTLPSLPFMDEYVARYADDFHLTPPQARGLQGASSEQSGTEKEQEQEQRGSDRDPLPRKTSEPKKRASKRCPTDFEVTPDLREWARMKYPGVNLERETEKFRDHEYKHPKTDWPAAWRTWISKAADFRPVAAQQPAQRARAFPSS
jgi:hypothetical protein